MAALADRMTRLECAVTATAVWPCRPCRLQLDGTGGTDCHPEQASQPSSGGVGAAGPSCLGQTGKAMLGTVSINKGKNPEEPLVGLCDRQSRRLNNFGRNVLEKSNAVVPLAALMPRQCHAA